MIYFISGVFGGPNGYSVWILLLPLSKNKFSTINYISKLHTMVDDISYNEWNTAQYDES